MPTRTISHHGRRRFCASWTRERAAERVAFVGPVSARALGLSVSAASCSHGTSSFSGAGSTAGAGWTRPLDPGGVGRAARPGAGFAVGGGGVGVRVGGATRGTAGRDGRVGAAGAVAVGGCTSVGPG